MYTFGLSGGRLGLDPLVLLLLALAVEALVGGAGPVFRFIRHPVEIIGGLVAVLDRKLNREHRSQGDRAARGALVVLVVVLLSAAVGWGVAWLSRNHDFGWILEVLLLIALIAQRDLYDSVRAVGLALRKRGLEAARQEVSQIVGRDASRLDEYGIARAAIESCAENFCDGVVAPVFWYVLFGFPGLLVFKAVNTMDSMIGYRTPRYRAFGFTAARLDDILNLIPARLAALLLVLAALFAPTARPVKGLKGMLRDAGRHRSPNAGWTMAAAAGALGLALAGPRHYSDGISDDPWIGDGRARASSRDISRMLTLYLVACLINALLVAALAVIRLNAAG